MKTTIAVAAALVMLVPLAATAGVMVEHGHKDHTPMARSGIKGGLTMATFTSEFDADEVLESNYDERLGFAAGVWMNLGPDVGFSLQPEILYVQKGAKLEHVMVVNSTWGDKEYQLDYVEVPLLLRLNIPVAEASGFYVMGGPAFAFNVKADRVVEFEDGNGVEVLREDIDELVKDTETSWIVGVGVQAGIMTIEGRYSISMDTILEEGVRAEPAAGDGEKPNMATDLKNEVVAVMVGFAF